MSGFSSAEIEALLAALPTVPEPTKVCMICHQVNVLSGFHRHPKMADGHINKCKKCAVDYALKYNATHPETTKRHHKQWTRTEAGKKKLRELMWKFPERESARRAVKKALKDGVIQSQRCFICGDIAQAHHPDYSRPLDVVWLCGPHHSATHQMARKLNKQLREKEQLCTSETFRSTVSPRRGR